VVVAAVQKEINKESTATVQQSRPEAKIIKTEQVVVADKAVEN
jgi:hypothetical protein